MFNSRNIYMPGTPHIGLRDIRMSEVNFALPNIKYFSRRTELASENSYRKRMFCQKKKSEEKLSFNVFISYLVMHQVKKNSDGMDKRFKTC
jgi:hypothetical protein